MNQEIKTSNFREEIAKKYGQNFVLASSVENSYPIQDEEESPMN